MNGKMNGWLEVCAVERIPRAGARVLRTGRGDIALFRTADDRIFALQDRCPHRGGPLSQGIVHGCRVTCPLHSRVLELLDGRAVPPDAGCAESYPVRVTGGVIHLYLGPGLEQGHEPGREPEMARNAAARS